MTLVNPGIAERGGVKAMNTTSSSAKKLGVGWGVGVGEPTYKGQVAGSCRLKGQFNS